MVRVIYASSRARHCAIGTPWKTDLLPSTFALCATVDNLRPVGLANRSSRRVGKRERRLVGLTRFELVTPRLSSVCSNQLSYRPPTTRLRRFVVAGRDAARACLAVARRKTAPREGGDSLKTR
jgi:hypothetical protein